MNETMRAELIYKSEVDGKLRGEPITLYSERDAEQIMDRLVESHTESFHVVINEHIVRIIQLKWIKIENNYDLYRLVSVRMLEEFRA